MPIHDWTKVDAGLFHDFHQSWVIALRSTLTAGYLPDEYFALAEQSIRGPVPDVLTLHRDSARDASARGDDLPVIGGTTAVAVSAAPPIVSTVQRSEVDLYARRADRIVVRHRHGNVVAVIEIVSPGNKASHSEFRRFLAKSVERLQQGVHLLIVDLFPPSGRDPSGIHGAIWGELTEETFDWPDDRRRTVVSYDAGPPYVAYVEPLFAGMTLPRAPLFLAPEVYVPAPLEETYQDAWKGFPSALRGLLEPTSSSRTT